MSSSVINSFLQSLDELITKGQAPLARGLLDKYIASHPGSNQLLHKKMMLSIHLGNVSGALGAVLAMSDDYKNNASVSSQIVSLLASLTNINVNEKLELEISRLLNYGVIDCSELSPLICRLFRDKIVGLELDELLNICNQQVFIRATLRNFWLTDRFVEPRLTALRKKLLELHKSGASSILDYDDLVLSLIFQGNRNEYVFFIGLEELEYLDEIDRDLVARMDSGSDLDEAFLSSLLMLLMYRSPCRLQCASKLSRHDLQFAPNLLAEFIRRSFNLDFGLIFRRSCIFLS